MPFVVQCPYCQMRARVPDRALGGSGKCARCASAFTLVPAEDQRVPEMAGAPADASSSDLEPSPAASTSAAIAEADDAAEQAAFMMQFDAAPIEEAAREPTENDAIAEPDVDAPAAPTSSRVRPETAIGAVAFLIASIALVCASLRPVCFLVLPLSGLALLISLTAVVLARRRKKRRFALPISASAASGILLFVALLSPALLGPTYARSRQPSGAAPAVMRAIPLTGAPLPKDAPDWADASKYALQRGDLRVQVVNVEFGPPPGANDEEKKEPPPKDVLMVRVRVQRAQLMKGNDDEVTSFDQTDKRRPTLLDGTGKSYALQDNKVTGPAGAKRRSGLFPIATLDEVLVFEPPPAGVEPLKLELPATATVGGGVFRFSIPAAMIARAPEQFDNGK